MVYNVRANSLMPSAISRSTKTSLKKSKQQKKQQQEQKKENNNRQDVRRELHFDEMILIKDAMTKQSLRQIPKNEAIKMGIDMAEIKQKGQYINKKV